MSNKISNTYKRKSKSLLISVSLLFSAVTVSGCSNFTRFDFPIFGLDKEESTTASARGSAEYSGSVNRVYPPLNRSERASAGSDGYYTSMYGSNRGSTRSGIVREELPAPTYNDRQTPAYSSKDDGGYSSGDESRSSRESRYERDYSEQRNDSSGQVTVRPGDTLYSLARNNNVSLGELKRANGLHGNIIHVGQQLTIPGSASEDNSYSYRRSARKPYSSPRRRYDRGTEYYDRPTKRRRPKRRVARYNSETYSPPRRVRRSKPHKPKRHFVTRAPEVVNQSKDRAENYEQSSSRRTPNAREIEVARLKQQKERELQRARAEERRREAEKQQSQSEAVVMPTTSGRFRWPVRGRIISNFGIKRNGARNDGINLSVPAGTEVRAAESGVVAYAGNELKGYGNLVLIRHKDKWVTAYAHNSRILVRRGQRIKRGQVIARAGKSGSVSQPQVHFELRKGDKPVNPLKYM
ncbi:MAG: peptidoglycan DD-metalloendopeptidase family protein [Methyloligellaceae bacterium]